MHFLGFTGLAVPGGTGDTWPLFLPLDGIPGPK
jgi:hypothetical protein